MNPVKDVGHKALSVATAIVCERVWSQVGREANLTVRNIDAARSAWPTHIVVAQLTSVQTNSLKYKNKAKTSLVSMFDAIRMDQDSNHKFVLSAADADLYAFIGRFNHSDNSQFTIDVRHKIAQLWDTNGGADTGFNVMTAVMISPQFERSEMREILTINKPKAHAPITPSASPSNSNSGIDSNSSCVDSNESIRGVDGAGAAGAGDGGVDNKRHDGSACGVAGAGGVGGEKKK
jgi:hypothetical protein